MPKDQAFLEALLNISRRMAEIRDTHDLLDFTMSVIVELVGAQRGYLLLRDATGQIQIEAKHDTDPISDNATEGISFSILNQSIANREPQRITNAIEDPDLSEEGSINKYQLRSVLCVPLISRERVLGAIYVENRERANLFKKDDLEKLSVFANQTAVVIDNAILAEQAQKSRERVVVAREDERRRMRRDLHDSMGPSLAAVILSLDAIGRMIAKNPEVAIELVTEAREELVNALSGIRQIVHDLRPPLLDEVGIISAMREFITTLTRTGKTRITLNHMGELSTLPAAVEVALYRVTLEAVTNVVKHARATYCEITLSHENNRWLTLSVEDNGNGFDDITNGGLGLISMRERAEEIGGRFFVEDSSLGGVKIRAEFPLQIVEVMP